jgi:hypothetical protein
MDAPGSIDLEQPRSIREILRVTLDLYRRYPLLFVILALSVIAPYDLIVTAVTGSGPLALHPDESKQTALLLDLLNFSLIGALISALHMHAVILISQGQRPRLADVGVRGLRVLPVVMAAEIVAGMGIALGFVALIIPGILLLLRWSVVAQTAAIEQEGWLPSLRRSGQLTAGHYWHIFGLLIAVGLSGGGITSLATLGVGSGTGAGAGYLIAGIAVNTVIASFTALTLAILYLDLRARQGRPRVNSFA